MALNLSPLLHPLTVYLFEITTAAIVLGFTPPSSPLRLATLPFQVVCVSILILNSLDRTGRIFWASSFAGHGTTCLLHYIDTALLSPWSFETKNASLCHQGLSTKTTAGGVRSSNKGNIASRGSVWDRLRFGYRAMFSYRNIGMSDEVKNVPPFSIKNPQYVPSRGQFLLQKLATFLVCYTILDFATSGPPEPDANARNFAASKVPFFSRLSSTSSEDLIVRLATTIGLWVSLYCVIQAASALYAFICVAFNVDEPKAWRPSFSSAEEAYSVRRFWGSVSLFLLLQSAVMFSKVLRLFALPPEDFTNITQVSPRGSKVFEADIQPVNSIFWHQFQRQNLTVPANFLVFDLLRLQSGSLAARYAHLLTVFMISGLQHALIDMAEGYSWQSSGSVQFFFTQAAGIMLEDTIQAIYRKLFSDSHGKQMRSGPVRCIGYIWVAVFLVWSTPVWIYPALRMNKGEEKEILLPYSFVGLLKS